jgi:hypothetical protein
MAGMRGFELAPAVLWGVLLLGLVATAAAVALWRRYLTSGSAHEPARSGPANGA